MKCSLSFFFSYDNLVLRDHRLYLRLRVDYPSIIRVNRKLFAVLLVQTAQPDFCDFLVRSSFFYLELLLTPLITASYLVASSQARSYGRLKTTYSDRLTWKNRLGREVGDSRCNPGMQRSNDLVLCCNNANPVAIVINSSIQISIFLLFLCVERKKRLIHAWKNIGKKKRWNESARF